jgi:hypothetical protein
MQSTVFLRFFTPFFFAISFSKPVSAQDLLAQKMVTDTFNYSNEEECGTIYVQASRVFTEGAENTSCVFGGSKPKHKCNKTRQNHSK